MKNNKALWLALILTGLPALGMVVLAATTEKEVEEDQSLASQLVTPHKPWGKNYAKGTVNALFIINPGRSDGTWFPTDTRVREVVELIQRFDIKGEAFFLGGDKGSDFFGLELGRRRAEKLLEKAYDVYVFAGSAMDKLPPKLQYMVMQQVAKGAGLVCCGPSAKDFMTSKRRIQPLPPFVNDGLPVLDEKKPEEIISTYRLGKGRGVWLNYPAWTLTPREDFSWAGLVTYDYRMLWVGRAVLWAATRESNVTMSMQVTESSQSGSSPKMSLALKAGETTRVKGFMEIRRTNDGWKTSAGNISAKITGDKPVDLNINLPSLRAGRYFLDTILKSSKGVETFGAVLFEVKTDTGVEKVELDKSYVEKGDKISGKITLHGTPPEGSMLKVLFRDSYNRVLGQRTVQVTADNKEYAFDYTPDAFATIWMRAEAELVINGRDMDMKDASFTVPKRRQGQFNFLQWDTPSDVLGYYAWQQMRRAGMSVCLLGSFSETKFHPVLAASDIPMVPYSTRILDPKDDKGYMQVRDANGNFQTLCWNDEPKIDEYVHRIVNYQQKRREHGVFCYSLGDEGVTLGCCIHPACIAAYRRYLQKQYGTIEALNASWGEKYKSFDEVDLLDHKDNMEVEAKKKSLWARWYDRQAFARYNLMQFSGRFVKAYRELDPHGVTGFEGTGGFGDDYDSILGINPFYGPYPSIGDDIVRSAAPRKLFRSNWMGYSKTGDALSDAAWRMVIKGMDSIWYWMWTGIGSWRGYLTPTLDFAPCIADLANEMKPVRNGLGDLILKSNMKHSGIAVFYSLPSALAHSVEESSSYVKADVTHQTWTRLVYDLGLDFRYLTDGMIRRGMLTTKEFKVLLLPMTQAVAPDEVAIIRAFVEAGGTVIADVRPAVFDGHCKPLDKGGLDDLFGIRRTGRGKAERKPIILKGLLGSQAIDVEFAQGRIDPCVEAVTARPLCQVEKWPVVLVNTIGKGQTILLNFQLLSDKIDDTQAAIAQRLMQAIFKVANVKADIAATAPDGGPLSFNETRVWENGDTRVFGLWRQMRCAWFNPNSGTEAGAAVPAKITLVEPQHVYDLRACKYLGKVSEIDTALKWGRANFFMALPYRISHLDLALSTKKPDRGSILEVEIRLDIPSTSTARHAVFVELKDPTGQSAEWARQVVILQNGKATVRLPVAFNDVSGKWRLRATELFSGASDEICWRVK
ncbi:MAG: beta-galactosidase [Kiritimatiellae bacterium]|nr:beta-galactosidase [Kiritimatiellia bacterium]MDD5519188.1 beta-galactosidase [Kiritimatiellia bacterium]